MLLRVRVLQLEEILLASDMDVRFAKPEKKADTWNNWTPNSR
jgi:hypothetical protein